MNARNEHLFDLSRLKGATGDGVRTLVIDSGVDTAHPDLGRASIATWSVEADGEGVLRVGSDEAGDVLGHGTAVCAIILANAPRTNLTSVRVFGGDLRTTSQRVLTALHWGIERGFDIINCSFGSSDQRYLPDYKAAVDRAFCAGALIVSACDNNDYMNPQYPAAFPTVLSTDFGPLEADELLRRLGRLVEFVARGENLRVAWSGGGYRTSTGSSFAAPHLTAIVCRIRELQPDWNACQVKAALYQIARMADAK